MTYWLSNDMNEKSSTLDDLEGQYCNRNCRGYSASFLATAGLLVITLRQHSLLCRSSVLAIAEASVRLCVCPSVTLCLPYQNGAS